MTNHVLFLPIEVLPREGLSRILVAYFALKKGLSVCIGAQSGVVRKALRQRSGIYFDKSLSKAKYDNVRALRDANIHVISIDEEGLAHENNARLFAGARVHEPSLQLVDKVFTWGESDHARYRRLAPSVPPDKFVVVGNPRIDLASPSLSRFTEFGSAMPNSYVLITSNHSVNNANGFGFFRKQAVAYGFLNCQDDKDHFTEQIHRRYLTFHKFSLCIDRLISENPSVQFILRPHPSENCDYWTDFLAPHRNCRVVYDHNYYHWVRSASAVIHSSCTTGLFCYFMQVPAIAYLPLPDDPYADFVANEVSVKAQSYDELSQALAETLAGQAAPLPEAVIERLNNLVYTEPNRTAAERMVDSIVKLFDVDGAAMRARPPVVPSEGSNSKILSRLRRFFPRRLKSRSSQKRATLFSRDSSLHYSKTYNLQCFDGLGFEFLAAKLQELETIYGPLDIEIERLEDNVYLIRPARCDLPRTF